MKKVMYGISMLMLILISGVVLAGNLKPGPRPDKILVCNINNLNTTVWVETGAFRQPKNTTISGSVYYTEKWQTLIGLEKYVNGILVEDTFNYQCRQTYP